jgi:hypothetical protein
MDDFDRHLLKKEFKKLMFKFFFFGFMITLLFSLLIPRRIFVDDFGRPVDAYGRPLKPHGANTMVYKSYDQNGPTIYDPYNLGGTPKNTYPPQAQDFCFLN